MTITIRAEITKEQWRDLRSLAIERDVPVQQLVGEALVEFLGDARVNDDLEAATT
jgi:hypothetical protein